MAYKITQTNGGLTTGAAAPANVAPTWGVTQAGSTLILFLAMGLNAAGSSSGPGGWQAISADNSGTAERLEYWVYQNNPGGLTTGTWTFTGGVQGAAWIFIELPPGTLRYRNADGVGNGTTVFTNAFGSLRLYDCLYELHAIAWNSSGGAYTDGSTNPTWTAIFATQTSTNSQAGNVNTSLVVYALLQGTTYVIGYESSGGTLAVAAPYASCNAQLYGPESSAVSNGPAGNIYVGNGVGQSVPSIPVGVLRN